MLALGLEEYYISPEEQDKLSAQCASGELSTEVAHTFIEGMTQHFEGQVLLEPEALAHVALNHKEHQRVPRPSKETFRDETWLFDPNEQWVWPELIPALVPTSSLSSSSIPCPDKKVWALKGSFGHGVGALILGMMYDLDDVHVDRFWFYAVKATKLCRMMELKINVINMIQDHMESTIMREPCSEDTVMMFYLQAAKRMDEIRQIYQEYGVLRDRQVYYGRQVQYHQTCHQLPSVASPYGPRTHGCTD